MATYKAIKGINIQTIAGDPGTVQVGEIWNKSILGKLRVGQTTAAAWSTGGNLNTAGEAISGAGTQTAGLCIGRYPPFLALWETYDGSSWTESAALNQGTSHAGGCGTQTAALKNGGYTALDPGIVALSEEWNGTSWTEGSNMNTARYNPRNGGTQTAAVTIGGHYGPPGKSNLAEEYNGASWTAGGDLGAARYAAHVFGTQTAAACSGGFGVPGGVVIDETEEYDGSSWSEVTNAPRNHANGTAWGTQTDGITVCGSAGPPQSTLTEECMTYDGTNWSTTTDYPATLRAMSAAQGAPTSAGLIFGGGLPAPLVTTTNEFTGAHAAAATVTSS